MQQISKKSNFRLAPLIKSQTLSSSKGFTIVELLVVIVVIGILAAITIVSYTGISQKAKVVALQSDLSNASTQIKLFQATEANGNYPTANNCPTPGSTEICLKASNGNTFTYTSDGTTFGLTETNTDGTAYNVTDSTAVAVGALPVTLTISAGANGTVNTAVNGSYSPGSTPTITATPSTNYAFSSWSGDIGCSGTVSHTITMDGAKSCTANFTIITYTLTITAGANGTVNAGGTYNTGTVQTITATHNTNNYAFSSWTGSTGCSGLASHTITMDANKTCTANFILLDTASWLAISTQVWAKANLNVGTMVPGTLGQPNNLTNQTNNATLEKYCYLNNPANCTTYGGLYQWDEAMQYVTTESAQGICPTGSHIPTDAEWKTLEMQLGMSQVQADISNDWRGTDEGTKLKSGGSSGLNMPLAGLRYADGSFYDLSGYTALWSSSESSTIAWKRNLASDHATVYHSTSGKGYGYSVRCLGN